MTKACTICKDCIANHYWHLYYQDWCFVKFMMSVSNFKNKLVRLLILLHQYISIILILLKFRGIQKFN